MNGDYNVLDPVEAERGVRKEIWHGWGYAKEHRTQFEQNKAEIQQAVKEQLARFRIFVAAVDPEQRLLERIEASIMMHLNTQTSPYCDIPDQGMMLAPRWNSEETIHMSSRSRFKLHGIPETLEI